MYEGMLVSNNSDQPGEGGASPLLAVLVPQLRIWEKIEIQS